MLLYGWCGTCWFDKRFVSREKDVMNEGMKLDYKIVVVLETHQTLFLLFRVFYFILIFRLHRPTFQKCVSAVVNG